MISAARYNGTDTVFNTKIHLQNQVVQNIEVIEPYKVSQAGIEWHTEEKNDSTDLLLVLQNVVVVSVFIGSLLLWLWLTSEKAKKKAREQVREKEECERRRQWIIQKLEALPQQGLEEYSDAMVSEYTESLGESIQISFTQYKINPNQIKDILEVQIARNPIACKNYRPMYVKLLSLCWIHMGFDMPDAQQKAESIFQKYTS